VEDGILAGPYRPAEIVRWNGSLHDEFKSGAESFYYPTMTPAGLLWTSECDGGQIYRRTSPGKWVSLYRDSIANSLTFEPYECNGSLYAFHPDAMVITGPSIKVFREPSSSMLVVTERFCGSSGIEMVVHLLPMKMETRYEIEQSIRTTPIVTSSDWTEYGPSAQHP
jgi:hypothetical protein